MEPHSKKSGYQLNFGNFQIGLGALVIVCQDFPFVCAIPGIRKNKAPVPSRGIEGSIRFHGVPQSRNKTFFIR